MLTENYNIKLLEAAENRARMMNERTNSSVKYSADGDNNYVEITTESGEIVFAAYNKDQLNTRYRQWYEANKDTYGGLPF